MKSDKTIAVTGAAGYAGSYIVKKLSEDFLKIKTIDKLNGDDFGQMNPNEYEVVIHLAAIPDNNSCDRDPMGTIENNIIKLYNLLERLGNNTLFIFASTAAVYGSSEHENSEDEEIQHGISTYAQTKIIGENFCKANIELGKNIVVLRLGTLFGASPKMKLSTVVNAMTANGFTNGQINCVNRNNMRAILSLHDLTTALTRIIRNPTPGFYNLNSANMNMGEIALLIQEVINCKIVYSEHVDNYSNFTYQISNKKFIQSYGEFRRNSFQETVQEIMEGLTNEQSV